MSLSAFVFSSNFWYENGSTAHLRCKTASDFSLFFILTAIHSRRRAKSPSDVWLCLVPCSPFSSDMIPSSCLHNSSLVQALRRRYRLGSSRNVSGSTRDIVELLRVFWREFPGTIEFFLFFLLTRSRKDIFLDIARFEKATFASFSEKSNLTSFRWVVLAFNLMGFSAKITLSLVNSRSFKQYFKKVPFELMGALVSPLTILSGKQSVCLIGFVVVLTSGILGLQCGVTCSATSISPTVIGSVSCAWWQATFMTLA